MTILLLFLVSIMMALGMALLPPLTGFGLGSVMTRAWLMLGALVFSGHYLYYLQQGARSRNRRQSRRPKVHRHFAQSGERSAEYR